MVITKKFGNTTFNLDNLAFKNKTEFLRIYKNKKFVFNRSEVWNELKKHIKVEPRQSE